MRLKEVIRYLSKWEHIRYQLAKNLLGTHETTLQKALSLSIGVLIGILPIWGFQMLTALFVASILRLNKLMMMAASHISFPPMVPLIIFLSFETGKIWVHGNTASLQWQQTNTLKTIQLNLLQYIYGSISLSIVAGAITFCVSYAAISWLKNRKRPILSEQIK